MKDDDLADRVLAVCISVMFAATLLAILSSCSASDGEHEGADAGADATRDVVVLAPQYDASANKPYNPCQPEYCFTFDGSLHCLPVICGGPPGDWTDPR